MVAVTIATAAIFGGGFLYFLERAEYEVELHRLVESSHHITGMLTIDHQLMVVAVQRNFDLFESVLGGPVHVESHKTVVAGGGILPQAYVGREPITPDFPVIDAFTRGSNGLQATVFVRRGDDFYRLATSLTDMNGQRAVGTALAREHPAYARLIAGKPYVGVVQLFGRYFMTKYQPVIGSSGQVAAALFAGLDMSSNFSRITDEINASHLRDNGYAFVIDAQPGDEYGTFLLHPLYQGKKVSELADERVKALFTSMLREQGGEENAPGLRAGGGRQGRSRFGLAFPGVELGGGRGNALQQIPRTSQATAGGSHRYDVHGDPRADRGPEGVHSPAGASPSG